MQTGNINVTAQNIFPIIKKFLYSDQEIFLRELVSNAVDATTKIKALASLGEFKGELGDLSIRIHLDKKAKTITISDKGVGMTAEEIEKYINEVAFSGAEDFVNKYKDKGADKGIIGHFGLGFYSAFMVAKKVEIFTRSFKDEQLGNHWTCEGNPEFTLDTFQKESRGTDIVLHIADDAEEFLEEHRISELLNKYCKFLPVPIVFGTKEITEKKDDDQEVKKTVDNIINNPEPAWTKTPTDLTDEDYKNFYRELYPMTFEEPLFHIHLNVDYPFNLTGILYFPKIKPNMDVRQNKIQLYQNQVFVTDTLEGIVPDFLTLLHGVIDSSDIPLNVSRSYLQSDAQVKKISGHITKKVADKLEQLFKQDREDFAKKWEDIKVLIEYGMLSEDKFFERAKSFGLFKDTLGNYLTIDELKETLQSNHVDKDGNTVVLYASDVEAQHSFIKKAEGKDYKVIVLDTPLTPHVVQKFEMAFEKMTFSRVDSAPIEQLIKKDDTEKDGLLDEKQKETLKSMVEGLIDAKKYSVTIDNLDANEDPVIVTMPEFMRRMKEMEATGGGGFYGMANLPETYNLIWNANHELTKKVMDETNEEKQQALIKQANDLALLNQQLLKGEELQKFVKRSYEMMR
ncbi:MAG: molecular chaperone HtpG [Cryomorphaceae bacterium]|nr:molecular chaperone HtpG [Cryomorphaceae bacterium]